MLAIEAMGWFSSDGDANLAQIRTAALHKLMVRERDRNRCFSLLLE